MNRLKPFELPNVSRRVADKYSRVSFPSPRPSPSGRGSTDSRAGMIRGASGLRQAGSRFSLSRRERAGVRGNGAQLLLHRMNYRASLLFAATILIFAPSAFAKGAVSPSDLRCEYAVDPLGVDSQNPRLFWTVSGNARGARQTAYQILVASSDRA